MINMRKKCILACLLVLVMTLIFSVASAQTCTVTASSLYLREEASSDSSALRVLRNGTKLEILSKSGQWYKVSYGKLVGYVFAQYVSVSPEKDDDTLQKGDKGDAVKAMQERLKELGFYKATCDGNYGNVTVTAVKAFQQKNGLTVDGVATEDTLKKMESDSAIGANGKTAGSTTTTTSTTLKQGSKGAEVKKLQQRLKELGYYTYSIDSEYGYRTVEAVKAFQRKNGLTADGVAGSVTLKKLNSSSAKPAKDSVTDKEEEDETDDTLKQGAKGEAVKALQRRLKELGYYTIGIDGDYGARTVEAVKAFQKKNSLTVDGVAGKTTLTKLNSDSAKPAKDSVTDKEEEDEKDDTLKQGAKGEAVKTLQRRLKELGYYTNSIDGDYGYRTVEAVKAFQKKNGLTVDGVAGTSTMSKLNSDSAKPAKDSVTDNEEEDETDDGTLKQGAKGEAVKALQRRLKELGYYTNSIDGDYGYRTVEAVKAFQKKNSLTVDGVAGTSTMSKLNSDSAKPAKDSTTSSTTLDTTQTLKKGDSGKQVELLQKRLKELGYYNTSIDGDYGYRTAEAVSEFQRCNKLTVNGTANSTTLKKMVSSSAISKSEADKQEEEEKEPEYETENLDWFEVGHRIFPQKAVIKVKDVKTGLIFNARVLYGTNHLDAEPLTAADTAILLKINGGVEFSWRRRPMLVQYNGHVYAASIYSEPHGDQTITDNNFEGQFCLHFFGSKLHKKNDDGVAVVDKDHQACVAEALKATW